MFKWHNNLTTPSPTISKGIPVTHGDRQMKIKRMSVSPRAVFFKKKKIGQRLVGFPMKFNGPLKNLRIIFVKMSCPRPTNQTPFWQILSYETVSNCIGLCEVDVVMSS